MNVSVDADLLKRLVDLSQGNEPDPLALADSLENLVMDIRGWYLYIIYTIPVARFPCN